MDKRTALRLADPTAELTRRAAALRPDLATAFDDGWLAVHICTVLVTSGGLAFAAGDVVLARPAVGRHPGDFIVFSERLATPVGLRHGEHFAFADEVGAQGRAA